MAGRAVILHIHNEGTRTGILNGYAPVDSSMREAFTRSVQEQSGTAHTPSVSMTLWEPYKDRGLLYCGVRRARVVRGGYQHQPLPWSEYQRAAVLCGNRQVINT